MEAFDCGLPDTIENRRKAGLPIPTPEQIVEKQKLTAERIATANKLAAEQAAAVKKAEQDKILKWNEEQAAKGDPYGLLRMGERYRDGDGVPEDLNKARDYFTRAAAAGSPDASDHLLKLNQVPTNSPATQ
jgi:TPR repeat protein